jgi:hypothetical protein
MVERGYHGGEPIVTQDWGGEGFFIVVSGKAGALRERPEGDKVAVNTFGPTDFLGNLPCLMMACALLLSLHPSQPSASPSLVGISCRLCEKRMWKCPSAIGRNSPSDSAARWILCSTLC